LQLFLDFSANLSQTLPLPEAGSCL